MLGLEFSYSSFPPFLALFFLFPDNFEFAGTFWFFKSLFVVFQFFVIYNNTYITHCMGMLILYAYFEFERFSYLNIINVFFVYVYCSIRFLSSVFSKSMRVLNLVCLLLACYNLLFTLSLCVCLFWRIILWLCLLALFAFSYCSDLMLLWKVPHSFYCFCFFAQLVCYAL